MLHTTNNFISKMEQRRYLKDLLHFMEDLNIVQYSGDCIDLWITEKQLIDYVNKSGN